MTANGWTNTDTHLVAGSCHNIPALWEYLDELADSVHTGAITVLSAGEALERKVSAMPRSDSGIHADVDFAQVNWGELVSTEAQDR